jgi:hypothetical protein
MQAYTEKTSLLEEHESQSAEGLDIRLVNSFHFETEQDIAALEAMISAFTKKRNRWRA